MKNKLKLKKKTIVRLYKNRKKNVNYQQQKVA